MLCVIIQYLLSPVVFLLTFILPVVFYFVNRRYVWCSILSFFLLYFTLSIEDMFGVASFWLYLLD